MPMTPSARSGDLDRWLALALAVPILAWQAWVLIPPHQQTLIKMRAARMTERAALAAGRAAGRRGLAVEAAAGTERDAVPLYRLAALVTGQLAGRAAAVYDSARDS